MFSFNQSLKHTPPAFSLRCKYPLFVLYFCAVANVYDSIQLLCAILSPCVDSAFLFGFGSQLIPATFTITYRKPTDTGIFSHSTTADPFPQKKKRTHFNFASTSIRRSEFIFSLFLDEPERSGPQNYASFCFPDSQQLHTRRYWISHTHSLFNSKKNKEQHPTTNEAVCSLQTTQVSFPRTRRNNNTTNLL